MPNLLMFTMKAKPIFDVERVPFFLRLRPLIININHTRGLDFLRKASYTIYKPETFSLKISPGCITTHVRETLTNAIRFQTSFSKIPYIFAIVEDNNTQTGKKVNGMKE